MRLLQGICRVTEGIAPALRFIYAEPKLLLPFFFFRAPTAAPLVGAFRRAAGGGKALEAGSTR